MSGGGGGAMSVPGCVSVQRNASSFFLRVTGGGLKGVPGFGGSGSAFLHLSRGVNDGASVVPGLCLCGTPVGLRKPFRLCERGQEGSA